MPQPECQIRNYDRFRHSTKYSSEYDDPEDQCRNVAM